MKTAVYVRVSTLMQAQKQTIQTQLSRLEEQLTADGHNWEQLLIFRDEGISGATLRRPSLSKLRDAIRQREVNQLYMTVPDRLARKYVHQALLLEEFEASGCQVHFIDRPMSNDPNDQLLLQIRGAVAEYESKQVSYSHGPAHPMDMMLTQRNRETQPVSGSTICKRLTCKRCLHGTAKPITPFTGWPNISKH